MSVNLVVRGATIVSPEGQTQGDLLVEDGKVAGIADPGMGEGEQVVEADGLHLLPGCVDPHVHMMDPGLTEREDFMTGTGAAAVGGVTAVVEHHRSLPFVVNADILREKAEYLADRGLVDYALFGGAHPDNVDQLRPMWEAGAACFKMFTCNLHGAPGVFADKMLETFRELESFGGLCLVHCEDELITKANEERLKAAGRKDFRVILEWRSREAEQVAVGTTALMARMTGARIIIAHASHPEICNLVNRERELGANIWIESCPQYFHLSEDQIDEWGPWHKFTPPARDRASSDGMWERLEAGEVNMICADHAPATKEDKLKGLEDIWDCSFGLPGVETGLSMMLKGVNEGRVSLERLVESRSATPAKVYGLWPRKGNLNAGADADFVMIDMQAEKVLTNEDIVSKVGWTPFEGTIVKGLPLKTYVRGHLVAEDGKPVAEPGWGEFLPGPGLKR